ncbi:MAG: radical SAM protein [Acidobacteria bacterium RIFCSPLOWO2_12_FULL_67_14]|nr:MAG: radical SAM protein [Acidobacteria bacterium RIFCSPLOWO2_02_FULL_67_21]OFW35957.1 MAG: radical SAM protein [Acidobacteria bacterium RIFCSPLOWO2_12_FULL_67_14]
MRIHLVNPSDVSFGVAVITPRWLYVLAAATPEQYGPPTLVDETLEPFDPNDIEAGDIVGIGIHTGNAYRGYALGRQARERGAFVVFGGVHSTLYPDEARSIGGAHAVVRGDGDLVWSQVVADCVAQRPREVYEGGRLDGRSFFPGRWELLPPGRYMWASVQTVRGCPKHCSFCSVWRTDGQQPRLRGVSDVIDEIRDLRSRGYRFIILADDNFYPVTLTDLAAAGRRADPAALHALEALREERFELMARLAELPKDMAFFTQITMEAAEDPAYLDAMARARIKGALVGVESVTAEGLKSIYKDFNLAGDALVERLQVFRAHGVHVLASFIFGLPTDAADTFDATAALAQAADVTFAQFVLLQPFPGTVDFERWERTQTNPLTIQDVPITRHWLLPTSLRPKIYMPHPHLTPEQIRNYTQQVWDRFYSLPAIWKRARCVKSLKMRLAFVLVSKLYRQMYANTGIATDSARHAKANRMARYLARSCRRLFVAPPGSLQTVE